MALEVRHSCLVIIAALRIFSFSFLPDLVYKKANQTGVIGVQRAQRVIQQVQHECAPGPQGHAGKTHKKKLNNGVRRRLYCMYSLEIHIWQFVMLCI